MNHKLFARGYLPGRPIPGALGGDAIIDALSRVLKEE
ncbi:MAG: hypothetical protein QOH96_1978 [Blastocatellia bacterium]|jgi:hypothetical protein|nr:hypothetical protein [Blastocatellia bacterium]